ncbi:RNA-directed DNA polymerase from mobile element jockey-like [Rhizophagus irregularis DAOM 181602=DAOM 197198]|nr:RNA-directed DNA polymerase from mobile element jockey-like [Rhizophagus irregularis DAOM 181602=DAOM 197198]
MLMDLLDWIISGLHLVFLLLVFSRNSCLAILAKSRLKQKKEMRTIFSYTSTSAEQWIKFTAEVDDSLGVYLDRQYHPSFDFSSLFLDRMWHALKAAILSAAIETLPFQKVSNTHRHLYSPELTKLIAINKFLDRFLYRLTTRRPNRPTQLSQMITALPSYLENLASLLPDYTVPTYSTTPQAAITHFQSIVSPPLVHYSSIASFPVRWQLAYTPLSDVSTSLYDPVLTPISLQEWSDVISSMPNNKASGPSKISYEMIKHLSSEALDFSLLLANTCLSRGDIPADWHEAVVYPIPKPMILMLNSRTLDLLLFWKQFKNV